MKNKLLDTYALVGFFKGENFAAKVKGILESIEKKEIKGFVSTITISELFYILSRFKNMDFAKTVLKYVKTSHITAVPVSIKIAEKGGEFKFKYTKGAPEGLPIADAIIAATAWKEKATIVSSSEHFDKIKEITVEPI